MLLDVILAARDRGLYHAITDCGAGGFSSAVGEMGEKIGAEVWLDRAPVKYEGLSYTEIWISEAQERMILSVGPDQWEAFSALAESEGVEATIIGKFVPTGRLKLKYGPLEVADLAMEFLHDGRPPVVREAVYTPPPSSELTWDSPAVKNFTETLIRILGSANVASKEWVIRQYDHEVQGGSVVKPLVGVENDGPSDAAVLRPVLASRRGIAVSCGMNPCYADFDTYHMAASAIDEAVRNCVAVGANPARTEILDNFCWGNTDRPQTLGSLVRAALACHDVAVALGTPFISGKDSLNNEFRYVDSGGRSQSISIPPSLLISALGQLDDVAHAVTMDLKQAGNLIYIVGMTKNEMGGSHFARVHELPGGHSPQVDAPAARRPFAAVHQAIVGGHVRACHDLSEGGLAVSIAEMAFAGGLGAAIELSKVPHDFHLAPAVSHNPLNATLLFSESNTRFLCEVPPADAEAFERKLAGVPHARLGSVTNNSTLEVFVDSHPLMTVDLARLKAAWQAPFHWQ